MPLPIPDVIAGRNWRLFLRKAKNLLPKPFGAALVIAVLITGAVVIGNIRDTDSPAPRPVVTTTVVGTAPDTVPTAPAPVTVPTVTVPKATTTVMPPVTTPGTVCLTVYAADVFPTPAC